jgi:hypothetical protein
MGMAPNHGEPAARATTGAGGGRYRDSARGGDSLLSICTVAAATDEGNVRAMGRAAECLDGRDLPLRPEVLGRVFDALAPRHGENPPFNSVLSM